MFARLFGFRGRIGRTEYAILSIGAFGVVALMVPLLLVASMSGGEYGSGGLTGSGLLIVPIALAGLWIQAALAVRRLHDMDRAAWHLAWMVLVPLPAALLPTLAQLGVSSMPWIWLCAAQGTEGPNRFGAPPGPVGDRLGSVP
ncbi:DUF805 domain-containing protein [Falsiroseomonas sp. HW251]|uniref:DUF805 domain-containing protein n=1 Tax=Falsiroseomonas sp. HW251 TaxID=3390998 RepID=UPI003D3121BC